MLAGSTQAKLEHIEHFRDQRDQLLFQTDSPKETINTDVPATGLSYKAILQLLRDFFHISQERVNSELFLRTCAESGANRECTSYNSPALGRPGLLSEVSF